MAPKSSGNGTRKTRKVASVQPPVTAATLHEKKNGDSAGLEELIRQRAYELYLQRGGRPGGELEDWKVAEQEVLAHQFHA